MMIMMMYLFCQYRATRNIPICRTSLFFSFPCLKLLWDVIAKQQW